jgi:hypothetical protein
MILPGPSAIASTALRFWPGFQHFIQCQRVRHVRAQKQAIAAMAAVPSNFLSIHIRLHCRILYNTNFLKIGAEIRNKLRAPQM